MVLRTPEGPSSDKDWRPSEVGFEEGRHLFPTPSSTPLASHDLGCLGEGLHVGGGAGKLHGHKLLYHMLVVSGSHGDSRLGHSPVQTRERIRP